MSLLRTVAQSPEDRILHAENALGLFHVERDARIRGRYLEIAMCEIAIVRMQLRAAEGAVTSSTLSQAPAVQAPESWKIRRSSLIPLAPQSINVDN